MACSSRPGQRNARLVQLAERQAPLPLLPVPLSLVLGQVGPGLGAAGGLAGGVEDPTSKLEAALVRGRPCWHTAVCCVRPAGPASKLGEELGPFLAGIENLVFRRS